MGELLNETSVLPSLKEPRDRCTKGEEGRGVMFSFRSLKSIPLVGLMRPD